MTADTNTTATEVVDAYFTAVAQNDLQALTVLAAEDFKQYPPPLGAEQDRQQFVDEWQQRIEDNPGGALVYERDHQLVEVVEAGSRAGTWVHDWGVYRRTDGQLAFKLGASFRIGDGHIHELQAFYDRLDVMTQSGFTLSPPAS